ncbi:MAG: hypothetical protein KGJ12_06020 [Gammaproteobacteria bacterium]|nr:hypothetical protein [Gammaproteobacteria bacterium]
MSGKNPQRRKVRNLAAKNNPLLRKGGAHGKTRKAERRSARVAVQRNLGEPADKPE